MTYFILHLFCIIVDDIFILSKVSGNDAAMFNLLVMIGINK